jgi:hypothetical protein
MYHIRKVAAAGQQEEIDGCKYDPEATIGLPYLAPRSQISTDQGRYKHIALDEELDCDNQGGIGLPPNNTDKIEQMIDSKTGIGLRPKTTQYEVNNLNTTAKTSAEISRAGSEYLEYEVARGRRMDTFGRYTMTPTTKNTYLGKYYDPAHSMTSATNNGRDPSPLIL